MMLQVPVSVGELVDKITILEIKLAHVVNEAQHKNIHHELTTLTHILDHNKLSAATQELRSKLKQVNSELWQIEAAKRQHEAQFKFDDAFVQLARSVYIKNDLRASIKRQINSMTNSDIVEEKIY